MDEEKILRVALEHGYRVVDDSDPAHDRLHLHRVERGAVYIAEREGANVLLTRAAARVHESKDPKLVPDPEASKQEMLSDISGAGAPPWFVSGICTVVDEIGFSKNLPKTSLESRCVSDSDLLDAIGPIGVARTFAYAGANGFPLYVDNGRLVHFYEKLLVLKDRMCTDTAKELAEGYHQFMVDFVAAFEKQVNLL